MKKKKDLILSMALIFAVALGCENSSSTSTIQPTPSPSQSETNLLFDAKSLAGKNMLQVDKILGKPTDSWKSNDGPGIDMRTYAIGSETTAEFHNGRIFDLVVFFETKQDVAASDAYRAVGLDYSQQRYTGITKVFNNQNWIKITY